jgi:hypothetical protein
MFARFVTTALRKMNGNGGVGTIVAVCDGGNDVEPCGVGTGSH